MEILALLFGLTGYSMSACELRGAVGAAALDAMLATGRCRWRDIEGPLIHAGPSRTAAGGWVMGGGDTQRFALTLDGDAGAIMLKMTPPHYLDLAAGLAGPLETGMPARLIAALLEAPPVPPGLAEDVADRLRAALAPIRPQTPLPQKVAGFATVRTAPRAVAHLSLTKVDKVEVIPGKYRWQERRWVKAVEIPVIRLSFDYGAAQFAHGDPARHGLLDQDRRVARVMRDPAGENALVERLGKDGLRRLDSLQGFDASEPQRFWFSLSEGATAASFAAFVLRGCPQLIAEGWSVEVDPDVPLDIARPEDDGWTFDLTAGDQGVDGPPSGTDWFDLQLGVRVDGERLDILPLLLGMLDRLPSGDKASALKALLASRQAGGVIDFPLLDGRLLALPMARAVPILEGLLALWGDDPPGERRVSVFQASALDDLRTAVGVDVAWSGAGRLEALARELTGWAARAPTPIPEVFTATLRPYQHTGLDWLQMLSRVGFGGLLADDMGLGKTVQALAHLSVEQAAGRLGAPALVVAPTSVLPNWIAEAHQFAPALRTLVLRGPDRFDAMARIGEHDLVVTSYPLLARDRDLLIAREWSVVILDEGQIVRNPATAAAKAAHGLKARQKIILSGTPVENHLGDVWSLMHFLNPGLLGDAKAFVRRFRTPIEKQGNSQVAVRLQRRLAPFILRRTKGEVAGDLPPKTEIAEVVELNAAQTDLYESTRLIMFDRVRDALAKKGLARSSIIVLDALLKLRQVCCDPRLVRTASTKAKAAGSAKLERLLELVDQLAAEGRKALLFSQFTSMLALIGEALDARGLSYAWLTGDTIDRAEPVRRFQSGEVSLFLISLKAGGTGLNLTEADTVILYDPWWNPAVEAQAIDRAHRIGQAKPVFVHRLIAQGTIEEKMLSLQSRKRELAAALWSEDPSSLVALNEEDIRSLFGPTSG